MVYNVFTGDENGTISDMETIFISAVSSTIFSNTIVVIARIDNNCFEGIGGIIHEWYLCIIMYIYIYIFYTMSY
jgi:hypothetical protein